MICHVAFVLADTLTQTHTYIADNRPTAATTSASVKSAAGHESDSCKQRAQQVRGRFGLSTFTSNYRLMRLNMLTDMEAIQQYIQAPHAHAAWLLNSSTRKRAVD